VLECIVMVVVSDELIVCSWSWSSSVQMVEAVDDARLFSGGDEYYIELVVDPVSEYKDVSWLRMRVDKSRDS
jgi:hypothetical protein